MAVANSPLLYIVERLLVEMFLRNVQCENSFHTNILSVYALALS